MHDLHGYGQIYALGHKQILTIFDSKVTIEEKIDGSQFSFGMVDGELKMRSKGVEVYSNDDGGCSNHMFNQAVATCTDLFNKRLLPENRVYRCEFLAKPKHNILCYDKVPLKNLILFDVDLGGENYFTYDQKITEAKRLSLECVPLLFEGKVEDFEKLQKLLELTSILGGTKIEGFVVKNYDQFTSDKKCMKGKFVSEAFKETHKKEWKSNDKKDIIAQIICALRTETRWDKTIQHLKERGELTNSPKDIGNLLKEINIDIIKEEEEYIKDILFKNFKKLILRGCISGFPEYYKEKLAKELKELFDGENK